MGRDVPAPRENDPERAGSASGPKRKGAGQGRRGRTDGTSAQASSHGSERPPLRSDPAARPEGPNVLVELSAVQVNRVVRDAARAGSLAPLLGGEETLVDALAGYQDILQAYAEFENSRVSRSLLQALLILSSLPAEGRFIGLGALSQQLEISPSTVHRYLTTWTLVGLVERDPKTRHYRRATFGVPGAPVG